MDYMIWLENNKKENFRQEKLLKAYRKILETFVKTVKKISGRMQISWDLKIFKYREGKMKYEKNPKINDFILLIWNQTSVFIFFEKWLGKISKVIFYIGGIEWNSNGAFVFCQLFYTGTSVDFVEEREQPMIIASKLFLWVFFKVLLLWKEIY